MLNYKTTTRFDKDVKKLIKQGKPIKSYNGLWNYLLMKKN